MRSQGAAPALLLIIASLLLSGCAQSQRDKYSYEDIQDADFAQKVYFKDQALLVDAAALEARNVDFSTWVTLQTEQICDRLSSGTTFEALVEFFAETFDAVVSDAERFVGNAAGYGCSGYLN